MADVMNSERAGYLIQPAQESDLFYLAAIEQAAASVFPPDSIPESLRSDHVPLPVLRQALSHSALSVARDQQKRPVGFALLAFVEHLAVLMEIDVHPDHARQGLGSKLISEVVSRSRELGYKAVYLTTFVHIPWNAPFYAKLGFKILEVPNIPDPLLKMLAQERGRGMEQRVAMELNLDDFNL